MKKTQVSKEVLLIEKQYKVWLEMSGLSEREFLQYRTIANFTILSGLDENAEYKIVVIGYINKENEFVQIGEQFAFQVGDTNACYDLALILLYIANKLDSLNSKAPKFEQRENYFYNKIKKFIQTIKECENI